MLISPALPETETQLIAIDFLVADRTLIQIEFNKNISLILVCALRPFVYSDNPVLDECRRSV